MVTKCLVKSVLIDISLMMVMSTHPHNFLAQILVEFGLIGGIIYLTIFFILIKNFIFIILETRITINQH